MTWSDMKRGALFLGVAAFWAASLNAGVIAVLHVGTDITGAYGVSNIENYLRGDSRFSSVADWNVDTSGVPAASQLAAYESVLVVTDANDGTITGGGLGTLVGNVLETYINDGGRVVIGAFGGDASIGIDGGILTLAPYAPVTGANAGNGTAGDLNFSTADLSNFVFNGVSSFTASYDSNTTLTQNGIALAYYMSGDLAIATNPNYSVMLVNADPNVAADLSNGTDFGLVFANALAGPTPEPGTFGLMGLALAAFGVLGRRRHFRRKSGSS
jgi:hypothetical protein